MCQQKIENHFSGWFELQCIQSIVRLIAYAQQTIESVTLEQLNKSVLKFVVNFDHFTISVNKKKVGKL